VRGQCPEPLLALWPVFKCSRMAGFGCSPRFESFCLEMIKAGRTNFGAPVIWERIRWESYVDTDSTEPFKLPNIRRPFYARMFQQKNPGLAHHIAIRPLRVK